ncbi:unnamed protein product [Mytilus coruscus]|uniref:Uncharacterized protein n=1 Tax=Mytilus coruscus TaxID=42192 RepID=A0A6J8DVY9_MYTCO|nr:unnamed protein product [Mytilus coruscus]
MIYLWAGTCDLTYKRGKFIHMQHKNSASVDEILKQFNRAISIVQRYKKADIKFVDCPLLSISQWNKAKGHKDPESFKNADSIITAQIKSLNKRIWNLNLSLNKTPPTPSTSAPVVQNINNTTSQSTAPPMLPTSSTNAKVESTVYTPRISTFFGEAGKGEAPYDIWKYEVESLRRCKLAPHIIDMAVRRSLRGHAARVAMR